MADVSHLGDLIADAVGPRPRFERRTEAQPAEVFVIEAREEFHAAGFREVPETAILQRARELAVEHAKENAP